MSDLIQRQDAIDALVNLTCYGVEEIENLCNASVTDAEGWLGGIRDAVIELETLPSAEPEIEDFEWCHDCKEYDQEKHCCHRWTKVIRNTVEEVKSQYTLEYPKIIHCEDCKFYTPMNRALKTGIYSLSMHHLGDDGFCSDAEKRGEDEKA